MQSEQKQPEPTAAKPKGGRPKGFSPVKAQPQPSLIEDDGDYVVIRVQKKQLAKLLLKDLL